MEYARWAVFCLLLLGGCSASPQTADSAATDAALQRTSLLTGEAASAEEKTARAASARKIIYRAKLVLDVQDFAATEKRIAVAIQAAGGYLADFHEDRRAGSERGGHFLVRIPVDRFEQFLKEAASLGIAERREVHAEDITEEFVDLSARLKNKQQLESRLLELVSKRTDDIKDVIALEAELGRVREEVERMQGRLRFLSDRVALTTVEITAYERRGYHPEAETFAGRIAFTFFDSLEALRQFAEAWALFLVAAAPWLLVLAILIAPIFWWARRRSRRSVVATVV